jgi:uncharacterized RDD family membrane protein YckC
MTTGFDKDSVPPLGTRVVALLTDLVFLFPLVLAVASVGIPATWPIAVLAFVYFAAFPLTPWQGTPGKRIAGVRLCDRNGAPPGLRSAVVRSGATVAWYLLPSLTGRFGERLGIEAVNFSMFASLLLLVPWAAALFSARRQTLFDRLAGTFVVYRLGAGSTRQEQLASGRRRSGVVVFVLVLLGLGFMIYVAMEAFEDHDRRARVAYALGETGSAREKMVDFQEHEKRWPTPLEAGLQEWNPYPAGGGYRVHSDGTIVITFSEKAGLKGHSIVLRSKRTGEQGGFGRWKCEADPAFEPKYLPGVCRQ